MDSLSFDPIADRYDATRGGERRGRFIADVLDPWLPADGRIGEIGVGTALVAAAVAATGRSVVGVDVSPAMLQVAHRRFNGPLVRGDAAALPLAASSLGAVYAVWVFHVVGDLPAVVAECRRVLQPGGRMVAVVADESRRQMDPLVATLERRYRRRGDILENLEPLAAAAGLRRVHVEPLPVFRRPTSPAELADHLHQRIWAWLWEVPDDAWVSEVVPVIAALRARPDADRPCPYQSANLLTVWNAPA